MLSAKGGFEGRRVIFCGKAFWFHSVIGQLGQQVWQVSLCCLFLVLDYMLMIVMRTATGVLLGRRESLSAVSKKASLKAYTLYN